MSRVTPDAWSPKGITMLEDNAWTALRQTARSVAVTAGAGAGKTEFLAQKAAYLLETGLCPPPQRILAICFKTDAARNLARRVQARCPDVAGRLESLTFDAFTKGLLDRFRATVPEPFTPPANYSIVFPRARDYDDFLRGQATDLNSRQLERLIARTALPLETAGLPAGRLRTLQAYWEQQIARDPVPLSFPMINRLVDCLLRENPDITEALRLTYPHVFLDEFQDTTVAQFGLISSAFAGSNAVLTAVGDPKQRIMGWADAMPRSFDVFQSLFAATTVPLLLNWRSHATLVAVQRAIAGRIDPAAPDVEARALRTVDGDVAAIWEFATRDAERQGLARWLRREVDGGKVRPEDLTILVRQQVDAVETELAPALRAEGLVLRNLARMVGGIALQDLLSEELTEVVLALLRLATSDRAPEAWAQGRSILVQIYAIAEHDERANQQLLDRVDSFVSVLRQLLAGAPPDEERASLAVDEIIAFIGTDALRQAYPQYGREADFERVRMGLRALFVECAMIERTWPEALDHFEGRHQIPLMTVHKSKGLEFHTMIFFGLDNQSWWSLTSQNDKELSALFVAFTRAEQRAFFTSCRQRGDAIVWIDRLLIPAGVRRVHGP